jgi:transposase
LSRPGSLDADDQARLAAVRAGCPHLDALAGRIRDFAGMMTRRQGLPALEDWLTWVEADDQPELHSLAAGIRRDQDARHRRTRPASPLRRHGGQRQQD